MRICFAATDNRVSIVCVSHSVMSNSMQPNPQTEACQAPLSIRFSKQEYWSGLSFQAIFPTQGSNLGLLHCRQILLPFESPRKPPIDKCYTPKDTEKSWLPCFQILKWLGKFIAISKLPSIRNPPAWNHPSELSTMHICCGWEGPLRINSSHLSLFQERVGSPSVL